MTREEMVDALTRKGLTKSVDIGIIAAAMINVTLTGIGKRRLSDDQRSAVRETIEAVVDYVGGAK